MLAVCNEGCNNNFEIKKFKERKLSNGIVETYFKCPKCGKKYICFYTDREIRKLQVELRNKFGKASKKELLDLHTKVKLKMDKLKNKILEKEK